MSKKEAYDKLNKSGLRGNSFSWFIKKLHIEFAWSEVYKRCDNRSEYNKCQARITKLKQRMNKVRKLKKR